MQSINIHRGKAVLISLLLVLFLWGGWWVVSKQVYDTYQSIIIGVDLVKISVYGLWMPLGFLGVGGVVIGGAFVSCLTGVKANFVWGESGRKVINYVVGVFAFLGLIAAIFSYQWMTGQLEGRGYLYCKPLSRISAMGRHEVYVARPELCAKPNKIP